MPIPLPMAASVSEELVQCTECAKCCTYVAVGINAPTRPRYATDILWYLYHDRVTIYVDGEGEWCVQFETRCRHLAADLHCGIYATRPHICRAFDNETCEVNDKDGATLTFRTPDEFLDYLKGHRPRVYEQMRRPFVPSRAGQGQRVAGG